jgi:hypothetical protein
MYPSYAQQYTLSPLWALPLYTTFAFCADSGTDINIPNAIRKNINFFIIENFVPVSPPVRWISIKTESVEMIPVYLIEGCGKTYARINDTMPHTCLV